MTAERRAGAFAEDRFAAICRTLSTILKEQDAAQLAAKADSVANLPAALPLTVLFCGSTGAGKSTLVAALCGEALRVPGEAKSKATARRFLWNGVQLVDDPDIAEGTPEHLALAMSAFDLLVFVIPSRLFTQKELKLFKYLAVDRQRRWQIMLVVTKMSMSDQAESTLKSQLVEQLAPELSAADAELFYPTFVDLIDYLQSEGNPELLQLSNFDHLQRRLAQFVRERGPLALRLRPVQMARAIVAEGLTHLENSSMDLGPLTDLLRHRVQRHQAEVALHNHRILFELSQVVLQSGSAQTAASTMRLKPRHGTIPFEPEPTAGTTTLEPAPAARATRLLQEKSDLPAIPESCAAADHLTVAAEGLVLLIAQQRNRLAAELQEILTAEGAWLQTAPAILQPMRELLLAIWEHPLSQSDAEEMAAAALGAGLPDHRALSHVLPAQREQLMVCALAQNLLAQVEPYQKQAFADLASRLEALSATVRQEEAKRAAARARLLAIAAELDGLAADLFGE